MIEYVVDGRNRRVGKKVNGVIERQWIYDGQLRPVAEMNSAGTVTATYIYGTHINIPDYIVKGTTTYRVITDHLGSLRFVINSSNGTIAQRIDYDDWGNVLVNTNPDFTPFGFAGGIYDKDTKLTRFGARDYDAEVGRWIRKDPIGISREILNLYGYVHNDTINFFDPWGLFCIPIGYIGITDWETIEWGNPYYRPYSIVSMGSFARILWQEVFDWIVQERYRQKAKICFEWSCYTGGLESHIERYGEVEKERRTIKDYVNRTATSFAFGGCSGDLEGDFWYTTNPFTGEKVPVEAPPGP